MGKFSHPLFTGHKIFYVMEEETFVCDVMCPVTNSIQLAGLVETD